MGLIQFNGIKLIQLNQVIINHCHGQCNVFERIKKNPKFEHQDVIKVHHKNLWRIQCYYLSA